MRRPFLRTSSSPQAIAIVETPAHVCADALVAIWLFYPRWWLEVSSLLCFWKTSIYEIRMQK